MKTIEKYIFSNITTSPLQAISLYMLWYHIPDIALHQKVGRASFITIEAREEGYQEYAYMCLRSYSPVAMSLDHNLPLCQHSKFLVMADQVQ